MILRNLWKIVVVLLYAFSCNLLFGNGKREERTLVVPGEFSDFHLILNKKVPRDILDQFRYVDSIDAYYYRENDDDKLFKETYLYLKWGKLKKVKLESYIYLQNNDLDYYKPERILQICSGQYGRLETSDKIMVYCTMPNNIPSTLEVENFLSNKWKLNRGMIEFTYLPFVSFNELKNKTTNEVRIRYELSYVF
jgi:hypothetical protein